MTTGIYSLYWEEQDLIYIGQSQNIENRFKEHLYKLKNNKHTNYKVQNAYDLYGVPILNILEICSIEQLNNLEVFYTDEFNSINEGLNIVEAGQVGWGTNSNNSKYSKIQILKVFSLLLNTSYTVKVISNRVKVHKELVTDISLGNSHLWLQEVFPLKYLDMKIHRKNLRGSNPRLGIITPRKASFRSPQGIVYQVTNIPDFCSTMEEFKSNLRQHYEGLARVARKERKSHKGWTLIDG